MSVKRSKRRIFSIIIPVYNEEETIPELYKRLNSTLKKDFSVFTPEVIFVDDGSKDETFNVLLRIHKKNKNVKVLQLSRNFGQHIAISAGLENANGDIIALMDGDLQDAPEELIKLFGKIEEGYNLVFAIRESRKDTAFKKLFSLLFWKGLQFFSNLSIPSNQAMMRMFDKKILNALLSFNEGHRFYAGIFSWVGFRQTTCIIKHNKRYRGRSKYTFGKKMQVAIDAIFGFSNIPLYYISYLGIILALLSLLFGGYIVLRKVFFNLGIIGWPSLMFVLLFLGGIIIFSIGILGIYIGRVYQETLKRPHYIINNKLL